MKTILQFDSNEDGDREEMMIAVHAMDWALTAWDLDRELRNWLKHGHKFTTADEALEAVREMLREILDSRNITLDMIT